MYKQIETDKSFQWDNNDGSFDTPLATLADEWGGRAQITVDDHCYVILLRGRNGRYKQTAWIFPEAFDVLKTLPSLARG